MSDNSANKKISWTGELLRIIRREPKNQQALIDVLRSAEKRNLIDPDVLLMIEGALHVADMQVRDAMVAKAHMTVVNINSKISNIIDIVVDSAHSRFPVINDDINDVLGILLAKDLLAYLANSEDTKFDIKDMYLFPRVSDSMSCCVSSGLTETIWPSLLMNMVLQD